MRLEELDRLYNSRWQQTHDILLGVYGKERLENLYPGVVVLCYPAYGDEKAMYEVIPVTEEGDLIARSKGNLRFILREASKGLEVTGAREVPSYFFAEFVSEPGKIPMGIGAVVDLEGNGGSRAQITAFHNLNLCNHRNEIAIPVVTLAIWDGRLSKEAQLDAIYGPLSEVANGRVKFV